MYGNTSRFFSNRFSFLNIFRGNENQIKGKISETFHPPKVNSIVEKSLSPIEKARSGDDPPAPQENHEEGRPRLTAEQAAGITTPIPGLPVQPSTSTAPASERVTPSRQDQVSARTRTHYVFDPMDRSNHVRRAEDMSRVLERHAEPAFATEAEWNPQDENLRIPVRHIWIESPLIRSALTATNLSTDHGSILVEPTAGQNTVRSNT